MTWVIKADEKVVARYPTEHAARQDLLLTREPWGDVRLHGALYPSSTQFRVEYDALVRP